MNIHADKTEAAPGSRISRSGAKMFTEAFLVALAFAAFVASLALFIWAKMSRANHAAAPNVLLILWTILNWPAELLYVNLVNLCGIPQCRMSYSCCVFLQWFPVSFGFAILAASVRRLRLNL
jgi:hypothetical protein